MSDQKYSLGIPLVLVLLVLGFLSHTAPPDLNQEHYVHTILGQKNSNEK